jgi:hypothetical protein
MPARRRGHRRLCGSQQLAVSEGAGGSPAAGTSKNFELALKFAADGKLKTLIDQVLPLSEAAAAHRRAEAGGGIGRSCSIRRSLRRRRTGRDSFTADLLTLARCGARFVGSRRYRRGTGVQQRGGFDDTTGAVSR